MTKITAFGTTNKKLIYSEFPESYIELHKELMQYTHQELAISLSKIPLNDIILRINAIATNCNIILDGAYTRKDLDILCDKMLTILQKRRSIIV